MKYLFSILLVSFLALSCNDSKKEINTEITPKGKSEIAANYKSIEVAIEGMTCEIGCARLIQSKLSKVDGVSYTKVTFETKKGQFTFDSNILSKEDIIQKINGVAGGDLYSVVNSKDLPEIILPTN